jgi:hypothetical protein
MRSTGAIGDDFIIAAYNSGGGDADLEPVMNEIAVWLEQTMYGKMQASFRVDIIATGGVATVHGVIETYTEAPPDSKQVLQ